MEKINYDEFRKIMEKYSDENCKGITGVIVYKESSFDRHYTEIERSYRVSSHNRCFQIGKISNSLFGNCLDGIDLGVNLDLYFGDWEIDYCYIEGDDANA